MKLYVASSWRNTAQPDVVAALRDAGHDVYDFKHPAPGDNGFHWSELDPEWGDWSPAKFRDALEKPVAVSGFNLDWEAMVNADGGVLVLPSGRSAHLEAGYFVGAGKPLFILLASGEPELMYRMATKLCLDIEEVIEGLKECENGS
jgi:nucleoside 2-deoxyribosyltransferase